MTRAVGRHHQDAGERAEHPTRCQNLCLIDNATDQGGAVGEDADHVGATPDLLVQPLLRVVGPDLPPDLAWERGERQKIVMGGVQVGCGFGEFGFQGDEGSAATVGCHVVGVCLFEDGLQQRGHPWLGRLRNLAARSRSP